MFKPQKSYSVYEYKLQQLDDRFKEEELLRKDPYLENQIINVEKFVISKIVKPVIKDDMAHYEVKWKGYKEATIEPLDV